MNRLIRKSERSHRHFLIGLFIYALFAGCQSADKPLDVSILWKNSKATGLLIPKSLINGADDFQTRLKIQLVKPGDRSPILGEFKEVDNQIRFEPIVPLTRGLRYEVLYGSRQIAEIEIPPSESRAPELLSIYPTQDTVPENLLKIYLKFSQPMAEGRSLSHVVLVRNNKDTLAGNFLDLQPELWNREGTLLTLWLDPGRTKRDLIPNREQGAPLEPGENYTLFVSAEWKSKEGISMTSFYEKRFLTGLRDEQSPKPDQWIVKPPAAGTTQALEINLKEPLDYSLINDAIEIRDSGNNLINGTIDVSNEERMCRFVPVKRWALGDYSILAEGRLEDLAGNNLNRLFDRDISSGAGVVSSKEVYRISFKIR